MNENFSLSFPAGAHLASARRWLMLGVVALGIAGLFSLLIVAARTPAVATIPGFKEFFHVALVVHVDLSVLVWFLAMAAMLWSLLGGERWIQGLTLSAFLCMSGGTLMIALSAFADTPTPLMSNYIPVLVDPLFFLGIALLFCGTAMAVARLLIEPAVLSAQVVSGGDAQRVGIYTSAIMMLVALACFTWSARETLPMEDAQDYYETLFWGGGHALQFVWTQLAIVAWLWLASEAGLTPAIRPKFLAGLYGVNTLILLGAPVGYALYPVDSSEFKFYFTQLMIMGNGIVPLLAMAPLLHALATGNRAPERRALWAVLGMSLLVFAFGGAFGLLIDGQNVKIPAHYHGSIVGVTLAFMGLAYVLLPVFGYAPVANWRLAFWQPIIYGVGQVIHISALAYSGGYGVLRKTPGAEGLSPALKAVMGVMGLGGLLAIIGGLMFVVVVGRSMWRRGPRHPAT